VKIYDFNFQNGIISTDFLIK